MSGEYFARQDHEDERKDNLRSCHRIRERNPEGQRIKNDNLMARLNKLRREIKLAQGWGHKDRLTGLVNEYNQLVKTGIRGNGAKKTEE